MLDLVDALDRVVGGWKSEGGLRDDLLRLHGMAHSVINGARLAVAADQETLPELARDVASELRDMASSLEMCVEALEPLESLQPLD